MLSLLLLPPLLLLSTYHSLPPQAAPDPSPRGPGSRWLGAGYTPQDGGRTHEVGGRRNGSSDPGPSARGPPPYGPRPPRSPLFRGPFPNRGPPRYYSPLLLPLSPVSDPAPTNTLQTPSAPGEPPHETPMSPPPWYLSSSQTSPSLQITLANTRSEMSCSNFPKLSNAPNSPNCTAGLIRITPRHLPPSYRPRHPSPLHYQR